MCLIPVMNDYWIVPVQATQYGGLVYLLLYVAILVLLVHPVLSMVLFASQYSQVGIVNIFKLYGPIPEGIGYGYAFLIFVMQLKIIQQGSIFIKHLRFTYLDNLSIGTCNEYFVDNWQKCSSIFMDAQCLALNETHKYYAQGYCWNVQPFADSELTSSITSYMSFLLQSENGRGFDFGDYIRQLLQLAVIAAFAINGPETLISFLATLMLIFIMLIVSNNFSSFNRRSINLLYQLTDFRKLFQVDAWVHATMMAFATSGLGEVTVFCVSSFRSPHSKYFLTSTFIIVGRLIICIIGLFSLLDKFALLKQRYPDYRGPSHDSSASSFISLTTDVYSIFSDFPQQMFDHAELLLIYHIMTALAAIFTMFAVARRQEADGFAEHAPFVGAFIIFCCFYSFIAGFDAFHIFVYRHKDLTKSCSLHFYMALTIFLFTFGYGIKEYKSDARFFFPHTRRLLRKIREVWQTAAFAFSIVVLLLLQGYEIVMEVINEKNRILDFNKTKKSWNMVQEILSIIFASVPFTIPLLVIMLRAHRIKKRKLIQLSIDHPTQRKRQLLKAKKKRMMLTSRALSMFEKGETPDDMTDTSTMGGEPRDFTEQSEVKDRTYPIKSGTDKTNSQFSGTPESMKPDDRSKEDDRRH